MDTPDPTTPRPHASAPNHATPGDGGPPVPAELLEEVAARLRPVCAQMRAEHFNRLVLDVARFTLRWSEARPRL